MRVRPIVQLSYPARAVDNPGISHEMGVHGFLITGTGRLEPKKLSALPGQDTHRIRMVVVYAMH